jgi:uracil DNA glycosylase
MTVFFLQLSHLVPVSSLFIVLPRVASSNTVSTSLASIFAMEMLDPLMVLTYCVNNARSFSMSHWIHIFAYSSMSYSQVEERCTFPVGWERFFRSNWALIEDILLTLHDSPYKFAPKNVEIFRMLYEMQPKDIRVVIVGQSPYADGNACGIPFVSGSGKITKTLQNITKELLHEYSYADNVDINDVVMGWINEGVFMLNMAFTIGIPPPGMKQCEEYVLNHDVLWEEFVRNLVRYIAKKNKQKIPIILLGAVAWGLEDELMSSYTIIKAPFPTRDEFIGSGVFGRCDELVDGINWV